MTKLAKDTIKSLGLAVSDPELEKNIGRHVKRKKDKKFGLLAYYGSIYEIVSTQKHWGFVDGKYVPDKIGYRLVLIGDNIGFGCVGDVDEIEFVGITREDAFLTNLEIKKQVRKELNY